jgi:hypothetical protein
MTDNQDARHLGYLVCRQLDTVLYREIGVFLKRLTYASAIQSLRFIAHLNISQLVSHSIPENIFRPTT